MDPIGIGILFSLSLLLIYTAYRYNKELNSANDTIFNLQSRLSQTEMILEQYKTKTILLEQELNKHSIRHAARELTEATNPFVRPLNHCNCVPPANTSE